MIEFSMAFFSKIERNEKEKSVEFIEKNFLSKFSLMSFAAIATVRGGDYGRGFRTESSNKYVVLLAFEVLADSLDILPQKGNYSDKNGEREGRNSRINWTRTIRLIFWRTIVIEFQRTFFCSPLRRN